MQADAIAGQQIDLVGRGADIEKAYTLKTGSYTARGPLLLGAILAGAPPSLMTTLERFALPIGVAFQLRDDLLSAFGNPSQTGKPFGNDLRSGKRTLLVARALELTRGSDRATLKRVMGHRKASPGSVRRAVEVLERSGARQAVEDRIDALAKVALDALRAGKLPRRRRELLEGAALALTQRRS